MYTVIVADDEEEIRRGIIKKVKWEELGFQVIGEAANGADALELVEKLEPDLLLTDIRMPFLSGIDLARSVREVCPTVQIAFLSGFDDFSYAQQAIQYNIISYMLKPISSLELEEELRNIKSIIDRKFEEFNSQELTQKRMEKSEFIFPLLLDGFRKEPTQAQIAKLRQEAQSCGLIGGSDPEVYRYVVLVTSITNEEGDQTNRSHVHAIDTILKKYVRYASCFMQGRVVSVLAATDRGFSKYLHIIVDEIVQSIRRILHMEGTVGVSRSTNSLLGCRDCYLEAMNALSYSWQKEGNVHFIADEEPAESISIAAVDDVVSRTEELLRGGSMDDLQAFLSSFSARIISGELSPAAADFLISQMTSAILRVFYAVAGEQAAKHLLEHMDFKEYREVGQVMEAYDRCSSFCLKVKELLLEQRKKSGEVLCDKALALIQENYADPDLSVVNVSNEIGVSPNYLSALIKKTTGCTFVELLTRKRIEKARELLLCTPKKIWEITEECGYRDQHYFSYCFKKATGISPNQCRKDAGIK